MMSKDGAVTITEPQFTELVSFLDRSNTRLERLLLFLQSRDNPGTHAGTPDHALPDKPLGREDVQCTPQAVGPVCR